MRRKCSTITAARTWSVSPGGHGTFNHECTTGYRGASAVRGCRLRSEPRSTPANSNSRALEGNQRAIAEQRLRRPDDTELLRNIDGRFMRHCGVLLQRSRRAVPLSLHRRQWEPRPNSVIPNHAATVERGEPCSVTASTTQFAIKLKDGQIVKLDDIGNQRV